MDARSTAATTRPAVMMQVLVPDGTLAQHSTALEAAHDVFRVTRVAPQFAWQAMEKLADWEQSGATGNCPLSEAEDLAIDVLLCAQEAANQSLGVRPGEPAVELQFIEASAAPSR